MQNPSIETITIRAARELTIEHNGRTWRLYNGARYPDQPDSRIALLDAQPDQIVCAPAFAKARNLPHSALAPADIARVVVGWAPESRSWHLGLLLAAQPESNYQPSWCGLASWPSADASTYIQNAKDAGQRLARTINRPFHMIPARDVAAPRVTGDTQQIQATDQMVATDVPQKSAGSATPGAATGAAVFEDIVTQSPPFTFDQWELRKTSSGYSWRRRARWVRATLARAVGFAVLVVLYIVLGIGTQTSGLATVQPDWLPWMGLAVAVLLVGLALRQIWLLLTITDMIVDMDAREVRTQQRLNGRMRWRLPFSSVAYVLVSQTSARQQGFRRGNTSETAITQDVWLHLSDGERFFHVATLEDIEGHSHQWSVVRQRQKTAGRRRLRLAHYDTPLHHAARVLADAMQADIWLDIR